MFGPWPFVLRRGEEGRERIWKRGVSLGGEGGGKYYEQSMFWLMDSPSA